MPGSSTGEVDAQRLWSRLYELAGIGKSEDGGVNRLSFTREERAAKNLVASYMREAGLEVREDAAGNLIGRREGRDEEAPVVLAGSHADSVRDGGDFDGPLGVLGAVEALQTMNERGIQTERPLEVVAFTDEEEARFSFGMVGSRGSRRTPRLPRIRGQPDGKKRAPQVIVAFRTRARTATPPERASISAPA